MTPLSILLMDDETDSPVIQATLQHLRAEGFEVHTAATMAEAIEAYYRRFYDVFILDIDMGALSGTEGDGLDVLKRFISLHNETRVIMYSAAGRSPHWVAAINAHCFGYVHKAEDDALEKLVDFVRKSRISAPEAPFPSPVSALPRKVLVCAANEVLKEGAERAVQAAFGKDAGLLFASDPEDLICQAEALRSELGAIVLLQPVFKMRAGEKRLMQRLLSLGPRPHVLVACEARDDFQASILFIANAHPFRLVDTGRDDWEERLAEGLAAAGIWYGRREIFRADPEALARLEIPLSGEDLDEWVDGEDLDAMYADVYGDRVLKGEKE